VTGRLLLEVAGRLTTQSAVGVAASKGDGTAYSSVELVRWGVLFSVTRWSQRVDPAGSHFGLRRSPGVAGYVEMLSTSTKLLFLWSKRKLYYDRRSVGQSILVAGTHLGPVTNFSPSLFNYF
jgi:hypothetical protein